MLQLLGLGLIGGSLGLALKRNPEVHVTGYDRSFSTLDQAFRRGIIDTIATSIENACEHADVIIFATPVNTTVAYDATSGDMDIKRRCHHDGYGQYKRSDYGGCRNRYLNMELHSLAVIRWRGPIKVGYLLLKSICLKMRITY